MTEGFRFNKLKKDIIANLAKSELQLLGNLTINEHEDVLLGNIHLSFYQKGRAMMCEVHLMDCKMLYATTGRYKKYGKYRQYHVCCFFEVTSDFRVSSDSIASKLSLSVCNFTMSAIAGNCKSPTSLRQDIHADWRLIFVDEIDFSKYRYSFKQNYWLSHDAASRVKNELHPVRYLISWMCCALRLGQFRNPITRINAIKFGYKSLI